MRLSWWPMVMSCLLGMQVSALVCPNWPQELWNASVPSRPVSLNPTRPVSARRTTSSRHQTKAVTAIRTHATLTTITGQSIARRRLHHHPAHHRRTSLRRRQQLPQQRGAISASQVVLAWRQTSCWEADSRWWTLPTVTRRRTESVESVATRLLDTTSTPSRASHARRSSVATHPRVS